MLAGEMDFTPGGFLNDNPAQFRVVGSDNPAPHVMGTRCFQLAMLVVYESAFGVFCESPDNVRNQPGIDFLKGIPASWDETRVLEGLPGEYIAIARKSGNTWYVAGMSVDARTFTIRTEFLGDGKYQVVSWCDSPDSDRYPRKLERKETIADRHTDLEFRVAQAGGFTAILKPEGN